MVGALKLTNQLRLTYPTMAVYFFTDRDVLMIRLPYTRSRGEIFVVHCLIP